MAKIYSLLGTRIINRLQDLNRTQSWLADQLHISSQAVTKWMQGATEPSFSNLVSMAKILKCSVGYLAGDQQDENIAEVIRLMEAANVEDRSKVLMGAIAVLGVAASEARAIKKAKLYQ